MPNYGPALFVTAWKVAQVRALCPFLVFHSNHGLLCACCVRAWVADAKRTLDLRETFREQFMLGGKGCDSVRVVRVQNSALLKGASAVRQGCCALGCVTGSVFLSDPTESKWKTGGWTLKQI